MGLRYGSVNFRAGRAQFPYQLSERSYRVVDSKEDSVFVQVYTPHPKPEFVPGGGSGIAPPTGEIYHS